MLTAALVPRCRIAAPAAALAAWQQHPDIQWEGAQGQEEDASSA